MLDQNSVCFAELEIARLLLESVMELLAEDETEEGRVCPNDAVREQGSNSTLEEMESERSQ